MLTAVDWESRIGRRLRLHDLHVFFPVVKSGSMAKAATHLRVTQPAVSKSIGELEAVLGVRLFDRSTQGVTTTTYGEALMKCGLSVFDELRQGIRTIESLADPASGEVRIASLMTIAATILPIAIQRFAQKYPRVVLHLDEVAILAEQLSGLRDRKYDFTVARLAKPMTVAEDDLNVEVLFNYRMVLTAGSQSRWASRRKIDLADLVDEPWIMPPPDTWNHWNGTAARSRNSTYSTVSECVPAVSVCWKRSVVSTRPINLSRTSTPSMKTRMPSSDEATNSYVPALNNCTEVKRAEKLLA